MWGIVSVLRRLFSTMWGHSISTAEEYYQYCAGYTVLRRVAAVLQRDSISTCGGIASVLWRDSISTVEAVQYCGGIAPVHVWESISTVEAIQYCGGIAAVLQRDSISTSGG